MILDNNLVFSSGQSLITNTSTGSAGILDLATGIVNTGSTYVAPNLSFGNAADFGEDLGVGSGMNNLHIGIYLNSALTSTNSATLNVAFQGAVDPTTNSSGSFSSLTWTTYSETGAITASNLTLNGVIRMAWPHRQIAAGLPRFVRLFYQLPGSTAFSAGSVSSYVMLSRDDWAAGLYPSNFIVAA